MAQKNKKQKKKVECLPGQSVITVPTFPNIGNVKFTMGGNSLAKKSYLHFLTLADFRQAHHIDLKNTGLDVCYKEIVIGNPL